MPPQTVPAATIVCEPGKLLGVEAHLQFANGLESSLFGIRWTPRDDAEIDRLNSLVQVKARKFYEDAQKNGTPVAPEVEAVLDGSVKVYKRRWLWMPVLFSLTSVAILLLHIAQPLTLLVSAIFSFVWYDFFSGILHCILDDQSFIRGFPILSEPCLEFQWHHHIPLVSGTQFLL